jgi:hypothetical protein
MLFLLDETETETDTFTDTLVLAPSIEVLIDVYHRDDGRKRRRRRRRRNRSHGNECRRTNDKRTRADGAIWKV